MATEPLTAEKIYNTPEGDTLDLGGAAGSYLKGSGGTFQPVILSTQTGADLVQKGQERLDQLSGQPLQQAQPTNNYGIKSAPEPKIRNIVTGGLEDNPAYKQYISQQGNGSASTEIGTVKYINPQTGQTQSLPSTSITPDLLRSLQSQGYSLMDSSGSVPAWVLSGDTSAGETQLQADKAKADLENLKAQIPNFAVSDAQLQSQIDAIGKQWDSRIEDMKAVNERRNQSIKTLGVRIGSQYTGSLGGVFGGIVAEEERQGVRRIAELEGQKQAAISAAREAARTKNWEVFGKQLSIAEQKYKDTQDAVKELNKVTAESNKKLQEKLQGAIRDNAISSLFASGTTDPGDILGALSGAGIAATLKDVSDSLKTLMPDYEDIRKFAQDVAKNGAPASVINSIVSSNNMGSAIQAAGDYAQAGTGMIGEYLYYKRQAEANGQVPLSFDEYQTRDANRHRSIVNINQGGLTTQENQTYLTITNKYQADAVINAAIKASQINTLADQIIANPNNTSNQLASLYLFVKNLDPESAVREGELALAAQTESYRQKFENSLTRLQKGRVLSPEASKELAEATKRLVKTWEDTAAKKTKLYQSQANNSSVGVGNAFKSYVDQSQLFSNESTADSLVQDEEKAKQSFGNLPLDKRSEAIKLMELNPSWSYQEILQAL